MSMTNRAAPRVHASRAARPSSATWLSLLLPGPTRTSGGRNSGSIVLGLQSRLARSSASQLALQVRGSVSGYGQ